LYVLIIVDKRKWQIADELFDSVAGNAWSTVMALASPRYAEDYKVGDVFDLGQVAVTREEIIEFSQKWDPQPFHLDGGGAERNQFGGMIASGWHVTLLMMRMMNDSGFISHETSLGSPGLDGLKWLKPVHPGEKLFGSAEIIEVRVSRSKPHLGFVTHIAKLRNEANEDVYVLNSTSIVKTRAGMPS
jgi:acyl dehydratase